MQKQSCLDFGNKWVCKMKTKVLAQVGDAEVEWISAKVFCQVSSKGMYSSEFASI